MINATLESYIQFRANPEHDDKKDSYFAQWAGITVSELRKLKRKNKDWAAKALKLRREQYAEHISLIDKALLEAAKRGDTKAADLIYRRFDGWNPKIQEQTNNYYNFADLVKSIKKPVKKATIIKRDI